ncbi:MAG: DUF4623 domain-containing protein, partial [Bacillota bacterium]
MKRITLSILLILLTASLSYSQYTRLWEKSKLYGGFPTYLSTNDMQRGFAYGKVDGKERLYLVSRNGGNLVYVLNAATGDSVGMLKVGGVGGGTYSLNDIDVSNDGVVFMGNLATVGATAPFKVYKWTTENDSPVVAINYTGTALTGYRMGDKITVTGSAADNSLAIWAVGTISTGTKLVKFTTADKGVTFTANEITLNTGVAGSTPSVAPINDGSTGFYVKSNGRPIIRYDATGAAIDTINISTIPSGANALRYIESNGKKYIVMYSYGSNNEDFYLINVTNGSANATMEFATPSLGMQSNGNGVGDIAVKNNGDGTYTVFLLGTNNGVAAYKVDFSAAQTITIQQAKADANNDYITDLKGATVTVKGVVTSPDYTLSATGGSTIYMQDATAGFAIRTASKKVGLNIGDSIIVKGKMDLYRGLAQIAAYDSIIGTNGSFTLLKSGAKVPAPVVINIADVNSEKYEGSLVTVKNLTKKTTSPAWPLANADANMVVVDAKSDSTILRIDQDTDIDGQPEPAWPQTITGVITQFTSSATVYSDGYQLQPTKYADFQAYFPDPTKLYSVWAKTQASGNLPAFMGQDLERSMAYGVVNGRERLFVVSRNGGPKVIVLNAATGDSVATIPAGAEFTTGYFKLNCVDVSTDGIIFGCNMTLNASTDPFTIYRWDSETAAPKAVISFKDLAFRFGDAFSVYGKASDNSLTIFAVAKDNPKVAKFTTSDKGLTFKTEVIDLGSTKVSMLGNVALASDSTFYFKSYSNNLVHFKADGTVIDTVSSSVIGTSVTKIKYFEEGANKYLLAYVPNTPPSLTDEKLLVVDITKGSKNAYVTSFSPSIGVKNNGNGTGAVDFKRVDANTYVYYMLGTNNGIAAFSNNIINIVNQQDTLFYGNSKNLLKNPFSEGGYIAGTNGYKDLGKYQRFDFKKNDELKGFKFFFGAKKVVDTPDTISIVVKTVKANAPDSILVSIKTTVDQLDTLGAGNLYWLDNPIKVNGPVFVGFEWAKNYNDEFSILTDKNGEGDKANRAWELYSDGTYGYFNQPGAYSWGLDADLWIASYYKKAVTTGVNDTYTASVPSEYTLSQNYPNPFNPSTTISYSIPEGRVVTVKVYDLLGKEVKTLINEYKEAGTHSVQF